MKKFYLSTTERKIGGVCGGLSEYLNIDVTFVRLFFVICALFGGITVFAYLVLWIIAPRRPDKGSEGK